MNNLFKFAALGLALTAGLSSCGEKKVEETTTATEATTTEATTTVTTDTTAMAPAAEGAMAPAAEGAAPVEGAKMESTTTTTTEEVKK